MWRSGIIAAALVLAGCGGADDEKMVSAGGADGGTPPREVTRVDSGPPAARVLEAGPTPLSCDAEAVRISIQPISPATGEDGAQFRLLNSSSRPCAMTGHPTVRFVDRDGPIPFSQGGEGRYLADDPPRLVLVAPGHAARVLVVKRRCEGGAERVAARLDMTLPDAREPRRVALSDSSAARAFAFCGPEGSIEVSAVLP